MSHSECKVSKSVLLNALLALASFVWAVSTFVASPLDIISTLSSPMAMLSLLFFCGLVLVGCINQKLYWYVVPILVLFTPNAINDIFPSMSMSYDPGVPSFSLFTHVDVLLVIGVVRYCDFTKPLNHSALLVGAVVLMLNASVLMGTVFNDNFWRSVMGGYQVRYYSLFYLLFCFADPVVYRKQIAGSIMVSVVLVLLESVVFTWVSGSQRLTSGNYGVNSLGHLFAVVAVVFLSRSFSRLGRLSSYALAGVFCLAVVATGTRFSLLVIFGGYAALLFIRKGNLIYLPISIVFVALCLLVFVNFIPAGISLLDGFLLVSESYTDPTLITVTPESSSMVTRLTLWLGTLKMVEIYPWLGVGPGSWAFSKPLFSIPFAEVLDPHQDFLSYISSYGIAFGLMFYISVFLVPIFQSFSKKSRPSGVWFWLAIVVGLLLAGLSNAVTWKHQITALAYMSSLMIVFLKENKSGSQEN